MAMVHYTTKTDSKENAEALGRVYCIAFPPQGYSTSFKVYHEGNGVWVMSAIRSSSCD